MFKKYEQYFYLPSPYVSIMKQIENYMPTHDEWSTETLQKILDDMGWTYVSHAEKIAERLITTKYLIKNPRTLKVKPNYIWYQRKIILNPLV